MKSGIWIKLQSDNKNDKNPAGSDVTVVPQDFSLQGDKTPTSVGGELQQFSPGGSPISFQDKASGDCRGAQMYYIMQSMTHTSQQVRQGVLEVNSCRNIHDRK
ncbi:MAG: hypothetical protein MR436_17070 [Eubacterium sp.]|nr:hypothetical protein [Eubacterium sp.]